jgi:hypothetical protein
MIRRNKEYDSSEVCDIPALVFDGRETAGDAGLRKTLTASPGPLSSGTNMGTCTFTISARVASDRRASGD